MADDEYSGAGPQTSNFVFEVDGVEIGRFRNVSGLQVSVETVDFAEGGSNGFVHRLPGRAVWPHIVLRRGVTQSDALFDWFRTTVGDGFGAAGNKLERKTAAITVLSQDGQRLRAWEIEGAFPVAWKGPELSANETATADEELEIAHHGFRAATLAK